MKTSRRGWSWFSRGRSAQLFCLASSPSHFRFPVFPFRQRREKRFRPHGRSLNSRFLTTHRRRSQGPKAHTRTRTVRHEVNFSVIRKRLKKILLSKKQAGSAAAVFTLIAFRARAIATHAERPLHLPVRLTAPRPLALRVQSLKQPSQQQAVKRNVRDPPLTSIPVRSFRKTPLLFFSCGSRIANLLPSLPSTSRHR